MNVITRGFGNESNLVTSGFSKTITIVVTPVQKPREDVGGGGYVELPPEKDTSFELIDTKAINVSIHKPDIIVKVNIVELEVNAEHVFTKYNKINIVFKGIEND